MSRMLRNIKNFRLTQFLKIQQIPLTFKSVCSGADHSMERWTG